MGIYTFCYMCNRFGLVVLQGYMVHWGSICHGYMCILLYMKLIWCSGVAEIYGQLEEGMGSVCHGYMYIFLYVQMIWCSVVVLQRSMVHWWGVHLPWVYAHSAICEADLVQWCCRDLWSIPGGSVCHGYMYIVLYVQLIQCSCVAEIYG